jgi:two-component system, LuxR family, sensor kinase FixL
MTDQDKHEDTGQWRIEEGMPPSSQDGLTERLIQLELGLAELHSAVDGACRVAAAGARAHASGWYREFFHRNPWACLLTDPTGLIEEANAGAVQLLGMPAAGLVGRSLGSLLPQEQWASLRTLLESPLRSPEQHELRIECGTGNALVIEAELVPLASVQQEPEILAWILRDITERRRAREALQRSEERYRLLVENIPDFVWTAAEDGTLVFASQRVQQVCGYSAEELTSAGADGWWGRLHPDDAGRVRAQFDALLAHQSPFDMEYRILAKDGAVVWVHDRAFHTSIEGPRRYAHGICSDISERKRIEEEARVQQAQLAHMARLSTMGDMAAVLAHELNQPLGAIVNYVQGSLRRMCTGGADATDLRDALEEVQGQAQRAANLIRRLRSFIAKEVPSTSLCDLNGLVQDAVALIEHEMREHGVELGLELADDLPSVQADGVQIQQVVLNLLRNGLEAMGDPACEGEELTVCTRLAASGEEVEVAVCDRGTGIPEGHAEEIFAPFFTTKPGGLGVGLSLCRGIVRAHGGRMWMSRNAERGLTFHFSLPAVHAVSPEVPAPEEHA